MNIGNSNWHNSIFDLR